MRIHSPSVASQFAPLLVKRQYWAFPAGRDHGSGLEMAEDRADCPRAMIVLCEMQSFSFLIRAVLTS
jgi:hypothetical protein